MDTTPITARLSVIANAVNALKELQNLTYEEFAGDPILHASAERYFQVAIQASIDIGSMIIASESTQIPSGYTAVFPALAEMGILPSDFAQKLVGMAGFRNILVHMYLEVDLKKVYQYVQHNLEDFEQFAQYIAHYLVHTTKK